MKFFDILVVGILFHFYYLSNTIMNFFFFSLNTLNTFFDKSEKFLRFFLIYLVLSMFNESKIKSKSVDVSSSFLWAWFFPSLEFLRLDRFILLLVLIEFLLSILSSLEFFFIFHYPWISSSSLSLKYFLR